MSNQKYFELEDSLLQLGQSSIQVMTYLLPLKFSVEKWYFRKIEDF